MTDEKTLDALENEFGYRPREDEGEKWWVYQGTMIVIHYDRRPRLYKHGCGGLYYEIEPD